VAEDTGYTTSSGNVFTDLEVGEPEEALAKAELARRIGTIIAHRHLTQAQAAQLLGIDQPKVSALVRGHLTGFSTDRLFRFLNALDRDIEIVIKPKPRSRRRASIRVMPDQRPGNRRVVKAARR
jgi:predicted XRE-type DNA-binding protein